jgi:hypothetical protein
LDGRRIRANVFTRSVCAAGVYLKFGERQDVCPLGRVFCIGGLGERLSGNSNALGRSVLQTCATRSPREASMLNERAPLESSIVNFRYNSGWMHMALNGSMADFEGSIQAKRVRFGRKPHVRISTQ